MFVAHVCAKPINFLNEFTSPRYVIIGDQKGGKRYGCVPSLVGLPHRYVTDIMQTELLDLRLLLLRKLYYGTYVDRCCRGVTFDFRVVSSDDWFINYKYIKWI